jgi:hypothetical protein
MSERNTWLKKLCARILGAINVPHQAEAGPVLGLIAILVEG